MIEAIRLDHSIEKHVSSVFRTCQKHTITEDSAWDAFQETFLAYSRRRDTLDLESDPGPWLRETARRCSLAECRRQRRAPSSGLSSLDGDPPADGKDQLEEICLSEATNVLRHELQLMSQEDQQLLQFLYVECLSHREVAQRLGCPSGSLHAKAERARSQLRRRMERRGVGIGLLLLLFLLNNSAHEAWAPAVRAPQPTKSSDRFRKQSLIVTALALFTVALSGGFLQAPIAAVIDRGSAPSCHDTCGAIPNDLTTSEEKDVTAAEPLADPQDPER